jgi:hypothetical protein
MSRKYDCEISYVRFLEPRVAVAASAYLICEILESHVQVAMSAYRKREVLRASHMSFRVCVSQYLIYEALRASHIVSVSCISIISLMYELTYYSTFL